MTHGKQTINCGIHGKTEVWTLIGNTYFCLLCLRGYGNYSRMKD